MERIINITGWSKHHKQMDRMTDLSPHARGAHDYETGYVVFGWNNNGKKILLSVDIYRKLTLMQCADVLRQAEILTGNIYSQIIIEDNRYDKDRCPIQRKKYVYNKAKNSLVIWQGKHDLLPVYSNDNGVVCTDRDALADCLC